MLRQFVRALWRSAANQPPNAQGLVATQNRILGLMRFLPRLEKQSPALARISYRILVALFGGDRIEMARVESVSIDTHDDQILSVRIYTPECISEQGNNPGLVYYHGGGCVIGDLETHDEFCRYIAANNACVVISVGYRLAPKWPYPIPLEDAITAWNWVCSKSDYLRLDLDKTGVGGDSAGGLLAVTVCHQYLNPSLFARANRMPSFQWLIYPWLDCRMNTPSSENCVDGMILTRATMRYFISKYLQHEGNIANPSVSPALEEKLSGLPSTYLATAGFDPLEDEGKMYARRLSEQGISVWTDHFGDVMHGFIGFRGVCPTSQRYIAQMNEGLNQLLRDCND